MVINAQRPKVFFSQVFEKANKNKKPIIGETNGENYKNIAGSSINK